MCFYQTLKKSLSFISIQCFQDQLFILFSFQDQLQQIKLSSRKRTQKLGKQKKCPQLELAASVQLKRAADLVTAAESRAVRLRECPLRELRLYSKPKYFSDSMQSAGKLIYKQTCFVKFSHGIGKDLDGLHASQPYQNPSKTFNTSEI